MPLKRKCVWFSFKHQSNGTKESQKFVRAQHTVVILSMLGTFSSSEIKKSIGTVPYFKQVQSLFQHVFEREQYFVYFLLQRLITDFPFKKAGILTSAHISPTLPEMSKPLSANTTSPGINLRRNPQSSIINLSLALPPYPFDKKETAPWGVMPIKNLTVLWCLY